MEIKTKISKKGERKICEIPKSIRDNFEIGEIIILRQIDKASKDKSRGKIK